MYAGSLMSVTTLDHQTILKDESVLCVIIVDMTDTMKIKFKSLDKKYGSKAALQSVSQICQLFATVIEKTNPDQWWQPARET